ncbi:MAG TPA: ParB/RepB/Spo0J family partition protein [Parvularculaceae bacterium]|nr:ParB/RepB/Spo0J family partition protein [Parvularculaceae bacterium]
MSALKKQKGLGRGLDALLGDAPTLRADAEAAAGPRSRSTLPIEFLKPNPDQPRRNFNEDAIEELAQSIRARGLLQPILVRPKGPEHFEIVAGERRWRAAQRAKVHEVAVIIRELTDEAAAEIALIENVQRVDLNPVEEAFAYQRLNKTYGRNHDEIAKAVGKSRSHVANTLRLLGLPDPAIEALREGKISAGHARAILAAPKPQEALLVVLEFEMSVREAERFVQKMQARDTGEKQGDVTTVSGTKKSGGGRKDADTRALEADLAAALGLEVEIEHSPKGAGALTIRYLDLDQLDDICRRLMGAGV